MTLNYQFHVKSTAPSFHQYKNIWKSSDYNLNTPPPLSPSTTTLLVNKLSDSDHSPRHKFVLPIEYWISMQFSNSHKVHYVFTWHVVFTGLSSEIRFRLPTQNIPPLASAVSASGLSCVVGFAVQTFLSHKMELNSRCFATIIAQDPNHFILIWFRHRYSSHLQVKFLPNLRHIAHRLWAQRACILVMFSHFFQAALMDCMSTGHNNDIISGFKQILKTNGAIMMHCSFNARVTIF